MRKHTDVLREAGLKATAPRERLLTLLKKETVPRSAAALYKKLRSLVDEVTVYRALDALAEAGLVRRTDFRHGHAEYELALDRAHHHHLVCGECGAVEDVASCTVRSMEQRALFHSKRFATIDSHTLEFFGTCRRCAKFI